MPGFAKIKLFFATRRWHPDGRLWFSSARARDKTLFTFRDGLGNFIIRDEGIKIGWVSNRPSIATTKRARRGVEDRFLSRARAKSPWWKPSGRARGLSGRKSVIWATTWWTSGAQRAGVAATVADVADEARAAAHYVTRTTGGNGGVREVVEMILKAQNRWEICGFEEFRLDYGQLAAIRRQERCCFGSSFLFA